MLRVSKLSDYATVIMAWMAREPGRCFSSADVAVGVAIAAPTVTKLLKILAREHLLVSQRGARGGYSLARPAGEISLAQIIDAVDGPIGLTECSVTVGLCSHESGCLARTSWLRVNRVVRDALAGVSLDDFAHPEVHFAHPEVHPVALATAHHRPPGAVAAD